MTQDVVLVGGCHCGKVAYQSTSAPHGTGCCYCATCRSFHGAPFAAFTNVSSDSFQWTKTEGLAEVQFSKFATRAVCRSCHAPLNMVYRAAPDEIGIVAASIDEKASSATVPKPELHIYVAEKPSWYEIRDQGIQMQGPNEDIARYLQFDNEQSSSVS